MPAHPTIAPYKAVSWLRRYKKEEIFAVVNTLNKEIGRGDLIALSSLREDGVMVATIEHDFGCFYEYPFVSFPKRGFVRFRNYARLIPRLP